MKVALVTKADAQMTGLLRYAPSIYHSLRARGTDVALVHPRSPLPGWAVRMGKSIGVDAAAFFSSYPLSVRVDRGSICHLASQTLATLLLLQQLPRTVVTVHDIIPYLVREDEALSTYRNVAERVFDRSAMRALRRASALIAISDFTRSCLVDALGVAPERVHVVHRAVDREAFRPRRVSAAFRQQYRLEENQSYVLYVGSEDPRKNVATLLRATAILRQHLPAVRPIKAGSAHFLGQRERLLELVDELDLSASVRFLDHVPDGDLPLLYNVADVFVLPSLYEGFGLPALEAMSCGTPVIAANRASLPEVVGTGGTLVEPGDAPQMAQRIEELITQPERRAAASQAALEQAARFSLQRQAEETMAVYTHFA